MLQNVRRKLKNIFESRPSLQQTASVLTITKPTPLFQATCEVETAKADLDRKREDLRAYENANGIVVRNQFFHDLNLSGRVSISPEHKAVLDDEAASEHRHKTALSNLCIAKRAAGLTTSLQPPEGKNVRKVS